MRVKFPRPLIIFESECYIGAMECSLKVPRLSNRIETVGFHYVTLRE